MQHEKTRLSTFTSIAIGFALLFVVGVSFLFAFAMLTSSVSGTASHPNGRIAVINGPFSCSDNKATTKIEAGGHIFAFSPTTISVDGVPVRPLDSTVTDVRIEASTWSASLHVNGAVVTKTRYTK